MKKKTKWFDSAIMKEDESKTTENAKHFILNNGTRKAIFSQNGINYFDQKEKVWKPIDNSLKATNDGYLANLGRYTAKLSKNTENETIEISDGSDRISWEYIGINKNVFSSLGKSAAKSNAKRKSKLNVKEDIKDTMNLAHASHAIYADAEGNVDLEYSIESNGVKENIVIKEKSDIYHYYFLLRVSGFEIKTIEDGKIVEFYKPTTDEEFAEDRTLEFIMPAPFMYDANGGRSDDVKYTVEKMEEGIYIFSVEADPEWINAKERVFPVCIDPQLARVGDSHITVTHNEYQWCDCGCSGDCSCNEAYWMHVDSSYYPYIYLCTNSSDKTTAKLHIKKTDIDLTRNRLISAQLVFLKYTGQSYSDSVDIRVGNMSCTHNNEKMFSVPITDMYRATSGAFDIEMQMSTNGGSRLFSKTPLLQIEYQPLTDDPVRKNFSVENGVSAEFDVLSGNTAVTFDDISDPGLGVAVSHVYKPNDEITEYGKNFRLNLDEKLVKTSTSSTGAQYAYTDPNGDVHTFKEQFYKIGSDGSKVYITSGIGSITADADGRLWLSDAEVFRELTTDSGLRASARLEGVVNNAEWVEQRIDEEKQVEEQVKSYKNTLCNFVSVNKDTGEISPHMNESMLSSPDSVELFLSGSNSASHLLLSKEEALSYKSLLTQKTSLGVSRSALVLQQRSLTDNAESLLLQYNATNMLNYQKNSNQYQREMLIQEVAMMQEYKDQIEKPADTSMDEIYDAKIKLMNDATLYPTQSKLLDESDTLIDSQITDLDSQKCIIKSQIYNFPGIDAPTGSNGTLTRQYYNVQNQMDVIDVQLQDVNSQINLYESKASKYIKQFKSYYKEYLNLQNQLDKLKMQVPVAYLISDSTVKGFNAAGELVIVQDKYGKYVVVEREKYDKAGKTRISAVYDQDGRTMSFAYNANNRLSEICNTVGERVAFEYDKWGYLTSIKRDHQPTLTLTYKEFTNVQRISKIESSNKTFAELSYNLMGMLTKITRKSTVSGIAHDNIPMGSEVELSSMSVEYTSTETKLKYDSIRQEIYTVDQTTEQITAHYELVNGKVTNAERYTYNGYLLTKTEHAAKSCLNRYSYTSFAAYMEIETVEDVTYNSFKEPVVVVNSKYAIPNCNCESPMEQTTVEYTYNDDRKLTQKRTTHSYFDCCEAYDTTVAVEKYNYNPAGELVRKESYVEGEELKTGISIEEHVFNDKGVETQTFTYNSLDPSSKLYTENEVDEQGRTLAAFDESGEYKTVFDYERDGVTVKTERLPNGSKFSYGRDKDGTVTAITHSTENGEENSTTQLRTLDAVTEVKSGNNTVQYTYDDKRRVKSVSLNGVDDYVTYAYSGEHTNAETVTATMVNGTEATTIKNAHGNVTKSTCGNRTVTNTYNADQQLTKTVDSVSGTTTLAYDDKGNVTNITAPDHTETFAYDEQKNQLESKTITGNGINQNYQYRYKQTADKALNRIIVGSTSIRPATDALGRNTGKTIEINYEPIAEEKISYVKFGDHATNLPSTVRFASNGVFKESMQYRYDSMGNIIEISENGRSACRYEYDALGRLTREDNVAFGKTTTWAYDNNGNIIAKYEYAITAKPTNELHLMDCKEFIYCYADNSDQLISVTNVADNVTETFEYDDIGNPETYRGEDATWQYGRQLATYKGHTFSYDACGRRIAKNGITFTYDSNGNLIKQSNGLEFLYDHTGIFAVRYNNTAYFYRKDAQANIVELLDINGATVVKYKYDAWGNCKVLNASGVEITDSNNIGVLNPFRYRSYYYDTETNLYFLKTRYYDPEIARFITIDALSYLAPDSINGLNLYTYCGNNPVMGYDPNGTWDMPKWLAWTISGIAIVGGLILCATGVGGILGGVLIGAGAGSLINGYVSEANGGSFTAGYIGGAVSGALCGVGAGLGGLAFSAAANAANLASLGYLGLGALASFAGGFAGNLASTVYTNWHNSEFRKIDINWRETFKMSAIMGALNIFAGMGSGMSSIVGEMGKVATDMSSKLALQILAGSIAGGTEFFYDLISYLISKLVSEF